MKYIFTFLLLLLTSGCFYANAGDTFIAGFESGETGYTINDGWYSGYTWEIVSNTETTGINNSDKCIMTTATSAPDRWGFWVSIKLANPITINAQNRYFKMMVKRSPNTTSMALCIGGNDPWGPNNYFGRSKPAKPGVWGDVVVDLFTDDAAKTCENKQVQEFLICLGTWDGTEAGTCMIDNLALSDNSKPRGAKEIPAGLLVNYDNEALTSANFAGFNVQSSSASADVVDNPHVSDVNNSSKVMKYYKPANTTWWNALICSVNGIIPVTYPNVYLHIMMLIPDATQTTINITAPSGAYKTEKVYPADGLEWYDYVIDVSELPYISEIAFRFNQTTEDNWNNPEGNYYIDDIVLDSSSDPRTKITSGLTPTVFENYKIYKESDGVRIVSSDLRNVCVYSTSGQLLKNENAQGTSLKINLANGIYVLKLSDKNGNVSSSKLTL